MKPQNRGANYSRNGPQSSGNQRGMRSSRKVVPLSSGQMTWPTSGDPGGPPSQKNTMKRSPGLVGCSTPNQRSKQGSSRKAASRRTGFQASNSLTEQYQRLKGLPSCTEVKALFRNLPWLKREIYLWCDTTRKLSEDVSEEGKCLGQELENLLFSWRTVGIPKKDDTSRPTGVVSYLVRAWLSACAESLPQPHRAQWAGRKQTTVVQAIAHWLSACSELRGGESHLTKAYDLNHRALTGLEFEGVPRGIRLGKRADQWHSWPPSRSMALGGMVSVLVSWQPVQGDSWAFMDDRSTAAKAKQHDEAEKEFENILKYTEEFDQASGLAENMGKRQKSTKNGRERVEHLGINAAPADPSQPENRSRAFTYTATPANPA